ncbi:ABC transporter substrate-binding protein [Candidatus Gracilibacteria bacterium]|nr:ABC transporter substrate-binding protein [Candidatus Gracilibacteria bacterium]MCF7898388.1 ABC transporter substrate-binding protein [Candidatus Paceibacterota bacterium]
MVSKILLGVGLFASLFAMLIFSGKLDIGNKKDTPQGEVVMWGTLPESPMNAIVQEFNPQAKTYRVVYKEVREEVFNQKLLEALANGTGPDLIMAPYQIILSEASRIYTIPLASLGEKQFKDSYVSGASIFFSPSGAIALPVSIEPMVLFYNRTLFSKHGVINPPAYWDEVTTVVPKLTLKNNRGQFIESGIALGAPNTPYAKDIIMAIVGQLGQIPVLSQSNQMGEVYMSVIANEPLLEGGDIFPLTSVVRFFSQFADASQDTYSWNEFMGKADDFFVAEKLAMYIGYSGELTTLRERNPRAEIEMTGFPQTRGQNTFTTGMRMYGIATLKSSKNPSVAFAVEGQFAGSGISPSIAAIVGGVPAFRGYATTPGLSSVISGSMLVARGWYDSFYNQSTAYTSAMISDILNNRQGVSDATSIFVSRLQDLYTPLK